jgi:DNA-directed RNA polymerase specialized sigma24 family protein
MDDREVVAAIVAGDPSGLAAAYDMYAQAIYGYCRWMLREPAASEAVRQTFAAAAAELGGLRDGGGLRPWLYTVAREECYRRLRGAGAGPGAGAGEGGSGAGAGEGGPGDGHGELVLAALAGLRPHEREIVELSLRHDLDDSELSAVLGVSWSRAHALSSHARGQLERTLAALLMARTGREECRALDVLLAGWDGRLTADLAGLVARHMDQCQACAGHRHGALRTDVLAGLLPLAAPPDGLRDQVLRDGRAPEPEARRLRLSPSRLLGPLGFPGWGRVRSNPGAATAVTALVVWVAAAASVTLLTVTGAHAVRALVAQSRPGPSASAPAPAASAGATGTPRPSRPRHRASHRAAGSTVPLVTPPTTVSPSAPAPHSASPSPSPSPSHSASASPSASASASASPSPSRSPSHSPSPSPSPSPTPTPTPTAT